MKSRFFLLIALSLLVQVAIGQTTEKVRSADEVLKSARKIAAKENKNVFLMWHASWCGWCHRMDTIMNDPELKEYFDNNYVIEHLVVKESKDNKHLENPGAAEMLAKYKGDKSGIPFWVVLDKKGELLMDSFMKPNTNTGCPANADEVEYWTKVLKETSDIPEDGLAKIADKFRKK